MSLLTFDCETIPNPKLLPFAPTAMPPPTASDVPSNYKSPEAISKWLANASSGHNERVIKRMSLDPILGRIVCIGTLSHDDMTEDVDGKCEITRGEAALDIMERRLLESFWLDYATCDRTLTFNGTNFDIPFIEKRSRILGVPYTPINREAHIDLMRETSTRTYTGGFDNKSLAELRAWFGLTTTTDHDGSDVWKDYQAGDFASISSHCLDDVIATFEIARRIGLL